jgi:hypothetical protein
VITDPLTEWLCTLSPEHGPQVAAAIEKVPVRTVYTDKSDPSDARLYGAEWSVRAHQGGIDRARVMVATDTGRCPRGVIDAALQSVGNTPKPLRVLAENLLVRRKDLDLLLGFDLSETSPRTKLYVLQPAGRSVAGFSGLCEDILSIAGVHPSWTHEQMKLAEQVPTFLALDLRADAQTSGKLYFSFDRVDDADALLCSLKAEPLRERLSALERHISDNPHGRLVVTTRGCGPDTVDVTLHAHLKTLPELSPALNQAWMGLQAQAQQMGSRVLYPSYASWMWGPQPAESLYYSFRPPEVG